MRERKRVGILPFLGAALRFVSGRYSLLVRSHRSMRQPRKWEALIKSLKRWNRPTSEPSKDDLHCWRAALTAWVGLAPQGQRQRKREPGSSLWPVLSPYRSPVRLDDRATDREAHPHSIVFSGEEGIKQNG